MTQAEQVQQFLLILGRHRGTAAAIGVREMAEALGFPGNKGGMRRAQLIKAAAIEAGHLIGSSCGASHGWYQPASQAEVDATVSQYEARIRSLARLIHQTKGAAGFKDFMGQLAIEFQQEG